MSFKSGCFSSFNVVEGVSFVRSGLMASGTMWPSVQWPGAPESDPGGATIG